MYNKSLAFVKDTELLDFFLQHIRGHVNELELPAELDNLLLAESFWAVKKEPITIAVSEEDFRIITALSEKFGVSKRLIAVYLTLQEMKKFYAEV